MDRHNYRTKRNTSVYYLPTSCVTAVIIPPFSTPAFVPSQVCIPTIKTITIFFIYIYIYNSTTYSRHTVQRIRAQNLSTHHHHHHVDPSLTRHIRVLLQLLAYWALTSYRQYKTNRYLIQISNDLDCTVLHLPPDLILLRINLIFNGLLGLHFAYPQSLVP